MLNCFSLFKFGVALLDSAHYMVVCASLGQWRLPINHSWATVEEIQIQFLRVHRGVGSTVSVQYHL